MASRSDLLVAGPRSPVGISHPIHVDCDSPDKQSDIRNGANYCIRPRANAIGAGTTGRTGVAHASHSEGREAKRAELKVCKGSDAYPGLPTK